MGKSCSFRLPYVLFVLCLHVFVILVIFHFGSEGGTLVLITSVPGHCLPFHVYLECDLTNVWHQGFSTKRKDTFFMFINIFQYQIIHINCVKVKITAET